MKSANIQQAYSICMIDIGSPKRGNLGWYLIDVSTKRESHGSDLDKAIQLIAQQLKSNAVLLGLEAPLSVPLRDDLMLTTKARKCDGNRAWSAGAGAQVLAINIPIMNYLFKSISDSFPKADFIIDENDFKAAPGQVMIVEAFVSGSDKPAKSKSNRDISSHVSDAQLMARACLSFSRSAALPPTILAAEAKPSYFNLAAAVLLQCGGIRDLQLLNHVSPIYKPGMKA